MDANSDVKSYTVEIEGFILGTFRKVGDIVPLNERQAREFLREKRLKLKPDTKSAPKPAAKKSDTKSEAVQGF